MPVLSRVSATFWTLYSVWTLHGKSKWTVYSFSICLNSVPVRFNNCLIFVTVSLSKCLNSDLSWLQYIPRSLTTVHTAEPDYSTYRGAWLQYILRSLTTVHTAESDYSTYRGVWLQYIPRSLTTYVLTTFALPSVPNITHTSTWARKYHQPHTSIIQKEKIFLRFFPLDLAELAGHILWCNVYLIFSRARRNS